jgi:hypothetical protein
MMDSVDEDVQRLRSGQHAAGVHALVALADRVSAWLRKALA